MAKVTIDCEFRYTENGCDVISVGPGEVEVPDEFKDRALEYCRRLKGETKPAAPKKRAVKSPKKTK